MDGFCTFAGGVVCPSAQRRTKVNLPPLASITFRRQHFPRDVRSAADISNKQEEQNTCELYALCWQLCAFGESPLGGVGHA